MIENNIKNTISNLINEIKTTTENNLSNLQQIMEALIDKVNNRPLAIPTWLFKTTPVIYI